MATLYVFCKDKLSIRGHKYVLKMSVVHSKKVDHQARAVSQIQQSKQHIRQPRSYDWYKHDCLDATQNSSK